MVKYLIIGGKKDEKEFETGSCAGNERGLAFSVAGCAKKDPRELYTEAVKKNQELSGMDMTSVMKMTMTQGEQSVDISMDIGIQMADINTDKMKYVAKGTTSLMGQDIETSMFYTDGYYYWT